MESRSALGIEPQGSDNKRKRDIVDWAIVVFIGVILILIFVWLWPSKGPGDLGRGGLPKRKIEPEGPAYVRAYKLGLDHLASREYGEAVLDLEESVRMNKNYLPAQQKLGEARRLAEIDALANKLLLDERALELRAPVLYGENVERKRYELEGVSFRKAQEGNARGSKFVWTGIVSSQTSDGYFVKSHLEFGSRFFVRTSSAPAIGTKVKVYGTIVDYSPRSSADNLNFPIPRVDPRFVDYVE